MTAGRPPLFNSPEELQKKIAEYIAYCAPHVEEDWGLVKKKRGAGFVWEPKKVKKLVSHPISIIGFSVWADIDRDTVLEYSKKAKFSGTIKKLKQASENYYEELASDPNNRNPTGAIFNLNYPICC